MTDEVYCVTMPEPTTPEGIYAKALAEALQSDPSLTTAFVAANAGAEVVGILDPAIEKALPKGKSATAAKATLASLRELHAAIPADEPEPDPAADAGADAPAGSDAGTAPA